MLSRDGVIARYLFAFCFFFLSGSEMITGGLATLSGVFGCIELSTALLRYSPLYEINEIIQSKPELNHSTNPDCKSSTKQK